MLHAPEVPGFKIQNILGEGGFGAIFLAVPSSPDAEIGGGTVAIKVTRPGDPLATTQAVREVEALGAIAQPFVPRMVASGTLPKGEWYIAMERIEWPTLADRLDRAPKVALEVFPSWAQGILRATEAVHDAGFIHCDLKPENIFVHDDGRARLIDFGLARPIKSENDPNRSAPARDDRASDTMLGTAEYMAPEQCRSESSGGPRAIDRRTDVYALGVILYEMLTGRVPFFGSAAEVREAHLSRRPQRPSSFVPIPPALEETLLRCLAKDPEHRFADIPALAVALAQAPTQQGELRSTATAQATAAPSAVRQKAGLLFFEASADLKAIKSTLSAFGGEVGHSAGVRFVAVFRRKTTQNPARAALLCGQRLVTLGLASRALVDLDFVNVLDRSDGSTRFVSGLFQKAELFLGEGQPLGTFLTKRAAEVLSDLKGERVATDASKPATPEIFSTHGSQSISGETQFTQSRAREPLFGRDDLINRLLNSVHLACIGNGLGRPTIATVIAEVGYGKSHLFASLTERLTESRVDLSVLGFRAQEPLGGDAGLSLRMLLTQAMGAPPSPPADRGEQWLSRRLGSEAEALWPVLALALGWIGEDTTDLPVLKDLQAAPGALRSATARAAGVALRRLAVERPLCLLIDDAQWLDEITLDALEYALLEESRAPLWLCAFARPSFEKTRPFWSQRTAVRLKERLEALHADDAALLCRYLLHPAENVPRKAVEHLVERSGGIPLHLTELIRGLHRSGLIRKQARGDSWHLATDELDKLPDLPLVQWLAESEVGALPPPLLAHARLAALLGSEFAESELEGVLEQMELDGAAADVPLDANIGLKRLVGNGTLVSRGRGRMRFRHELVRSAVVDAVPSALKQRIHRSACHYYRRNKDRSPLENLSRLADHAAKGELRDEAAAAYLSLADRALKTHSYLDAERMFSAALEQLPDSADRPRMNAIKGRGQMRYRLGRGEDALSDLKLACAMAHTMGDAPAELELLLDEATALDWTLDLRQSKERVDDAAKLAGAVNSPAFESRMLMAKGRSHWRFNELSEASTLLEEAAEKASALGDDGYETLVITLLMLGEIQVHFGRIADAEETFTRAASLCRAHQDRAHLAWSYINGRALWIARKDSARAIEEQKLGIQIARELGVLGTEYFAEYNIAELLYQSGDLEEARAHVGRTRMLEMQVGGESGRPVSRILEARLLVYEKQMDAARHVLGEIRAQQSRLREQGKVEGRLIPSEEVMVNALELAARDPATIPVHEEDIWESVLEQSKKYSIEQEAIEIVEMRAMAAAGMGNRAIARRFLLDAIELAKRIPNVMEPRLEAALARVIGSP